MKSEQLVIGISSCLLGEPVRYDGRHKRDTQLVQALSAHFRLLACCPEVAIGLGVPRAPIQLVQLASGLRALGVADAGHDVTAGLQQEARNFQQHHPRLCGYVFKSRSPSCGLGSTPVYQDHHCLHEHGDGIFAARLRSLLPRLPVADEMQLQQPARMQQFVQAVHAYFSTL